MIKLTNRFDRDISFVVQPDHPYLLEGPDILAALNGNICGVFFIKYGEYNNISRLLSRMALTRLALPDHAKMFFINDPNTQVPQNQHQLLNKSFDEILEISDLPRLHVLLKNKDNYFRAEAINKVKEKHYLRFHILYKLTKNQLSVMNKVRSPTNDSFSDYEPVVASRWYFDKPNSSNKSTIFAAHNNITIAKVKFENRKNKFRILKNVCLNSLELLTTLDNGIPYLESIYDNNLFIPDQLPFYQSDPNKTARCTAFSGLAYCRIRSPESADSYYNYINRSLEEAEHVYYKKANRYNKNFDSGK